MASSSSQNHEKSTLFSSEAGGLRSIPFSNNDGKAFFEHTAGDKTTGDGLEVNCKDLIENLDGLTDEQLDELLQQALDINQRLKSFERKIQTQSHGESMADKMNLQEQETGTRFMLKRTHFLPPLEQTKTSLVTGVSLVKGTNPDTVGRQKKTSVM